MGCLLKVAAATESIDPYKAITLKCPGHRHVHMNVCTYPNCVHDGTDAKTLRPGSWQRFGKEITLSRKNTNLASEAYRWVILSAVLKALCEQPA